MKEKIEKILATFLLGVACVGMMGALDNQIVSMILGIVGAFCLSVCIIVYIVGAITPFKRLLENRIFTIWLHAILLLLWIWDSLLEYPFFRSSFLPMLLIGGGIGAILCKVIPARTKSNARMKR